VETTLAEILTNLALIQRDDGEVANNTIGAEQLKSGLTLDLTTITDWATATVYTVNHGVLFGFNLYRCLIAHTSGDFATDLAAGRWVLVLDLSTEIAAAQAAQAAAETAQAAAETAQTGAQAAEANAATSESNAAGSAAAAATAQTGAENAESNAAGYASIANTAANTALGHANNAATSETNAAASLAEFNGTYVRSATEPGTPTEGMLWWDTANDVLKIYDSSIPVWIAYSPSGLPQSGGDMTGAINLNNNIPLNGRETGGTARNLAYIDTSDQEIGRAHV